ncbi:MAG: 2Fe-2S iron-sulfur cluster-binding protein [Pyrinomonadaceae bacterium]
MSKQEFSSYLNTFSESDWLSAVDSLLPIMHEVDRNAVRIWFRFYPLELFRYLEAADDMEKAIQSFNIQGNYLLKDQIDASHHFLYGHRYWETVKAAIEAESQVFKNDGVELAAKIRQIAAAVAKKTNVDTSLLVGITAVGLMTLVQSGLENFRVANGEVQKPAGLMKKSPDAIVRERAKDDSQGLFGFLKTIDKKFTVNYTTPILTGAFPVIFEEEIASASAKDQSRDWKAQDERCWEGVVPVECRSAACGSCWIGVLDGEEKLSEVARLERTQAKLFGYNQPDDPKPILRLACQSKAYGNVTIVIPPWNGVFGKEVYGVDHKELDPATTSAKASRTVVKEAVKNQLM